MADPHSNKKLLALSIGSIGVVYGDIGTSPLYAFRESLAAASEAGAAGPEAVLGILSLILWTLIIMVTLKYVVLLLRADNHGEGGILSLMALAQSALGNRNSWILTLGIAGAALFYGDAVITPAISVLSALEGLKLVTNGFQPYVIPAAITIMILLFIAQRRGTEKVARFFSPVMLLWFIVLGAGGLLHIGDNPEVWQAFNPYHAFHFLTHYGFASFIVLGAVFLTVTGAEALYADLGHFGKKPIRLAWLWFVMPALMLNYIGQAALVLSHPEAAANSFYLLYPDWALLPMVILATMATVIASQAVITGAYSLTHQAVQLGLLPRLSVRCTSEGHAGQIYVAEVNWLLLIGVVLLIEIFHTSSALASAYGIAVAGTMVITGILAFVVMRHVWKKSLTVTLLTVIPLLLLDLTFFGANLMKLFEGGFVPLLLSAIIILMMRTWIKGSRALQELVRHDPSMDRLIRELKRNPPKRVEGTAIYFSGNIEYAPSALLQNLKHNKVLHEQNMILTLRFADKPYVPDEERTEVEVLSKDFVRVLMHFGFMESPNVANGLLLLLQRGYKLDMMSTSFFISRRNVVPSAKSGMPLWQDHIFIAMANNAADAADYFHLPLNRVVELGVQMTV